jgi:hypothetical protein
LAHSLFDHEGSEAYAVGQELSGADLRDMRKSGFLGAYVEEPHTESIHPEPPVRERLFNDLAIAIHAALRQSGQGSQSGCDNPTDQVAPAKRADQIRQSILTCGWRPLQQPDYDTCLATVEPLVAAVESHGAHPFIDYMNTCAADADERLHALLTAVLVAHLGANLNLAPAALRELTALALFRNLRQTAFGVEQRALFRAAILLCGCYLSLISGRAHHQALYPAVALSILWAHADREFPGDLTRLFCTVVAPYPSGTTVTTSLGEHYLVIRNHPDDPYHPDLVNLGYSGEVVPANPEDWRTFQEVA